MLIKRIFRYQVLLFTVLFLAVFPLAVYLVYQKFQAAFPELTFSWNVALAWRPYDFCITSPVGFANVYQEDIFWIASSGAAFSLLLMGTMLIFGYPPMIRDFIKWLKSRKMLHVNTTYEI